MPRKQMHLLFVHFETSQQHFVLIPSAHEIFYFVAYYIMLCK